MIILTISEDPQNFYCIPNNYIVGDALTLVVKDKQKNETTTFTPNAVYYDVNDLVVISNAFTRILYEGGQYLLTILNSSDVEIYKDNIFCTDQPINTYSINSGAYTELDTNNNSYIVL